MDMRRSGVFALVLITALVAAGAVGAADFPTKRLTYNICFNPGGESDITARFQEGPLKRGSATAFKYNRNPCPPLRRAFVSWMDESRCTLPDAWLLPFLLRRLGAAPPDAVRSDLGVRGLVFGSLPHREPGSLDPQVGNRKQVTLLPSRKASIPLLRWRSQFRRSQVYPTTASNSSVRSVIKNSILVLNFPIQTGTMTEPVIFAVWPLARITFSSWLSGVTGKSNAAASLDDMNEAEAPVSNSNLMEAWWIPARTVKMFVAASELSTQ